MAKARGAEDMMRSQEAYFGNETTMDEADPLRCLERGERLHLPPTLIVDGTADDRLNAGSISRFVSAYERAGGDIYREQFEGQGHTFIVKDPTAAPSIEAIDVIGNFVRDRTRDISNRSGAFEPARQQVSNQR
jgi:dienelactone hydrolase